MFKKIFSSKAVLMMAMLFGFLTGCDEVPDVVGMTVDAANVALAAAEGDLVVGAIVEESSEAVPKGSIISQDPLAGTKYGYVRVYGFISWDGYPNVDVVVSSGPSQVEVPDVWGMTQSDAEAAFIVAGLVPDPQEPEVNRYMSVDAAIFQQPCAFESVAPGSSVQIYISDGIDIDGNATVQPGWFLKPGAVEPEAHRCYFQYFLDEFDDPIPNEYLVQYACELPFVEGNFVALSEPEFAVKKVITIVDNLDGTFSVTTEDAAVSDAYGNVVLTAHVPLGAEPAALKSAAKADVVLNASEEVYRNVDGSTVTAHVNAELPLLDFVDVEVNINGVVERFVLSAGLDSPSSGSEEGESSTISLDWGIALDLYGDVSQGDISTVMYQDTIIIYNEVPYMELEVDVKVVFSAVVINSGRTTLSAMVGGASSGVFLGATYDTTAEQLWITESLIPEFIPEIKQPIVDGVPWSAWDPILAPAYFWSNGSGFVSFRADVVVETNLPGQQDGPKLTLRGISDCEYTMSPSWWTAGIVSSFDSLGVEVFGPVLEQVHEYDQHDELSTLLYGVLPSAK